MLAMALLTCRGDLAIEAVCEELYVCGSQPRWNFGLVERSPNTFKSHTMTAMTTTAFSMDFIEAAIGTY
jgi:hypothetical protein